MNLVVVFHSITLPIYRVILIDNKYSYCIISVSITMSTRMRQRACANEIEGITYKEGCHDAKEYEGIVCYRIYM